MTTDLRDFLICNSLLHKVERGLILGYSTKEISKQDLENHIEKVKMNSNSSFNIARSVLFVAIYGADKGTLSLTQTKDFIKYHFNNITKTMGLKALFQQYSRHNKSNGEFVTATTLEAIGMSEDDIIDLITEYDYLDDRLQEKQIFDSEGNDITNRYAKDVEKLFEIFSKSNGRIRPHMVIAGESGTGKTFVPRKVGKKYNMPTLEINAAQLVDEGIAGLSLSEALQPLVNVKTPQVIIFDEFDKLFKDDNHSPNRSVKNALLKVIEDGIISVKGNIRQDRVNLDLSMHLFIFSGVFNGAKTTMASLKSCLPNEFLGRVSTLLITKDLEEDDYERALRKSMLFREYANLYDLTEEDKESAIKTILERVVENIQNNELGLRLNDKYIHNYFLNMNNVIEF